MSIKNKEIKLLQTEPIPKLLRGRSKALKQLKQNLKLTLLQRQVLVGILLGDAHLSTMDKGQTYRLHVYQSEKHEAYTFHLYDIFKEWVVTPPTKQNRIYKTGLLKNKQGCMISFKTISSPAFRFYAHNFYGEKIGLLSKTVPKIITRCLTDRGLAYWFMDDGSLKSKQTKAVYLNTQGFLLKDVELLCFVLNSKFGLKAKPVKKNKSNTEKSIEKINLNQQVYYYQIYIHAESYPILRTLIKPYLLPEMLYKFPM